MSEDGVAIMSMGFLLDSQDIYYCKYNTLL